MASSKQLAICWEVPAWISHTEADRSIHVKCVVGRNSRLVCVRRQMPWNYPWNITVWYVNWRGLFTSPSYTDTGSSLDDPGLPTGRLQSV